MPQIPPTPKSPEVLLAQVAAFTHEYIQDSASKRHIYENLGTLAVEPVPEVLERVTTSHEHVLGTRNTIPEGATVPVATGREYLDFLRQKGGSGAEVIDGRAEMLGEYGRFKPAVDALIMGLASSETVKGTSEDLLGSGSTSRAFRISEGGRDYAVRIPKSEASGALLVDSHIAAATRARGVPHVEQIVAASYEDGVTIAEIMPGKKMGDLTIEDVHSITDAQLEQLLDTLNEMSDRYLVVDPKPSNLFYDPNEGFGIIDYDTSLQAGKFSTNQDIGMTAGWMAACLGNAGLFGKPYIKDKTPKDYATKLSFYEANLEVIIRYRAIVERRLQGDERRDALKYIDERIEQDQYSIGCYSDPEWVSSDIAHAQRMRSDAKKGANKPPQEGFTIPLDQPDTSDDTNFL